MKKTQLKDGVRNVRKQIVSFISIVVISAIGVMSFLGLDYAGSSLRINGSELYDRFNYRDIEIISTLLLTDSDLEAVKALDGVCDAEPVRFTSAKAEHGEKSESVNVITVTERINKIYVAEGRLPENASECALEEDLAKALGVGLNDRLRLTNSDNGTPEFMCATDFTVTGVVKHPDHLNTAAMDPLYVVTSWDAFGSDELGEGFMKAEVTVVKPEGINRYTKKYEKTVDAVLNNAKNTFTALADKRDDTVRGDALSEIEKNQSLLDEAKQKLEAGRAELDEKTKEYEDGVKQADEAEKKLSDAKPLLDDGWIQLEAGRLKLENAKTELEKAKQKLDDGKNELDSVEKKLSDAKNKLDDGFEQLEDAKSKIRETIKTAYEKAFKEDSDRKLIIWAEPEKANADDPSQTASYLWITKNIRIDLRRPLEDFFSAVVYSESVPEKLLTALYAVIKQEMPPEKDGGYDYDAIREALVNTAVEKSEDYKKLSDACEKWNKGHDEYIDGLEKFRAGLIEYEAGLKQYNDAAAQYEDGLKSYQDGLAEYNDKKSQYDKAVEELNDGRKMLADGKILLDDGEAKYADGLSEYEDGKARISEARDKVNALEKCRWITLDSNGNSSFVQLFTVSGSLLTLKSTFALMFVIVGSLVVIATVGKMVDEQRSLIGTQKAVGFYYREIFIKYLGFGVSAAVAGMVIGMLASVFAIAPFLQKTLSVYFRFDLTKVTVDIVPTVIVFAAGTALAAVSVWFASAKLLREPAVRLMQPKAPGVKKGYGGGSSMPLYSRLILLNMRMDLKRVIVTVVSVAGCCALIVIGITIKGAIDAVPGKQYGKGAISDYDLCVKYDPSHSEGAKDGIEKILSEANTEYVNLYNPMITYRTEKVQAAELYCGDIAEINEFYHINDINTGKPLYPTNEGVYVQRRAAEVFGLSTDSELEIAVDGIKTANVRVAGVFEAYFGSAVVMSDRYYNTVFGSDCTPNAYFVRLNGADADMLAKALSKADGFESVSRSDDGRELLKSSSSSVNMTVVMFIFIAAVMAGVVQMNLTNMYILQKKRELTIMRINGFTVKEVIGYVLRETVVTTALGIVIGLAVGSGIAYTIVRTLEQILMKLERGVNPLSWLIAAGLTVLFTVIVNAVALRKVKRLKLTDAA